LETWIQELANQIAQVPGVEAVVLGGSRATGTHMPNSDVDLGIYYRSGRPLDVAALAALAQAIDDQRRPDLVTPIGGWGPWINGGGWLTVGGVPVDFIYRDMDRVVQVIRECRDGNVELVYQPGHPHLFSSAIYMGEAALCQPLVDRDGVLAILKSGTLPYPRKLQRALVSRFAWEAAFSVAGAAKAVERRDMAYLSGCLFRASACMAQTLFAINARHLLNEKGAIARAAALDNTPSDLALRVDHAYRVLYDDPTAAVEIFRELAAEVEALVTGAGLA
jgi:predicted nucleotidyltransferase